MMHLEVGNAADWAGALSNCVVLVLIWRQISQVNTQMIQNDDQERFRRSWEFVKFYRDELREYDKELDVIGVPFEACKDNPGCERYGEFVKYFYQPRIHLFILLNQLAQHQEVEERVLFGYLEEDFNRFVEIGVTTSSAAEFRKEVGAKISLLLTLWGTHIKARHLLYSSQPAG